MRSFVSPARKPPLRTDRCPYTTNERSSAPARDRHEADPSDRTSARPRAARSPTLSAVSTLPAQVGHRHQADGHVGTVAQRQVGDDDLPDELHDMDAVDAPAPVSDLKNLLAYAFLLPINCGRGAPRQHAAYVDRAARRCHGRRAPWARYVAARWGCVADAEDLRSQSGSRRSRGMIVDDGGCLP